MTVFEATRDVPMDLRSSLEFDACPEFISEELCDESGQIIRHSRLGLHLTDTSGDIYTAIFRNISPSPDLIGQPQKVVMRWIKPGSKILYLEPRIERGDRFFAKVTNVASRDPGSFYSRAFDYSVFLEGTREETEDLPRLNVQVGDHLGIMARKCFL